MKTLAKVAVIMAVAILHCPRTQSCSIEVKTNGTVPCIKATQAATASANVSEDDDILLWKMPAKYHF